MRLALALLLLPLACLAQGDGRIVLQGAGATFPAPLYKKWIAEYGKLDPKVVIDYRDVGSGEGTRRFLDRAVDFGASDSALSDEQLASAVDAKLVPTTAGMIVLAYHLPGFAGTLKLPRAVYPEIFAGRIDKWNDPRIQAANPGMALPDRQTVLAVRLDSSGTTFAFTNHLVAASEAWRRAGSGPSSLVGWKGNAMLARGNEGVAALVKRNPWTIGYVEFGYAKRLGLAMAALENRAGRFVEPGPAAGEAALAASLAEVPANLRVFVPDPGGEGSYPIVSLTWLLLRQKNPEPARADALRRFVDWGLTDGQAQGGPLGYVALPPGLVERARAVARGIE